MPWLDSIKGIDPWITCTWSVDSWSSTPPAHSQAGLPTGRPEVYQQALSAVRANRDKIIILRDGPARLLRKQLHWTILSKSGGGTFEKSAALNVFLKVWSWLS